MIPTLEKQFKTKSEQADEIQREISYAKELELTPPFTLQGLLCPAHPSSTLSH